MEMIPTAIAPRHSHALLACSLDFKSEIDINIRVSHKSVVPLSPSHKIYKNLSLAFEKRSSSPISMPGTWAGKYFCSRQQEIIQAGWVAGRVVVQ